MASLSDSKRKSVQHKILSPAVSQIEICRDMLDTEREEDTCEETSGQWSRRRRIDGALNRAPIGFYSKIWRVLKQCKGISIEGQELSENLIKEMTEGELKFALKVESALNHIPEPEYRQLMVEALITLTIFSELKATKKRYLDTVIPVNDIITKAYVLYLQDQGVSDIGLLTTADKAHRCHRLRGICEAFYDTAPSGNYGTMTYMCRAATEVLTPSSMAHDDSSMQCLVQ